MKTELVTVREAAIELELSDQWVRHLINTGELAEVRVGIGRGLRLLRRTDVNAFRDRRHGRQEKRDRVRRGAIA